MLTATLPSNVHPCAGHSTFSALRAPRPVRRHGAHRGGALRMLDVPQDDQHQPASDLSPSPHPINATIDVSDDLKSQMQMLERQAQLNVQYHAQLTALQKEHADELRALQQEHEDQIKEVESSLRISGFENSNISSDLGRKAEEINEVRAHWRASLENLYARKDAADATPSSAQDKQADAADEEQEAHENWEGKALDEEFLRRKIFVLEQLFHQKPLIRHFDPATDGMETVHEAEIAALRKQLAEEERKNSQVNAQLSEALSRLERVRDMKDELQQELDRRDELEMPEQKNDHHFFRHEKSRGDSRSAHNPRLKVFLEELFTFSCDPRVEGVLKEEEERRLQGRNDDDNATRD